MCLTYQIFSKTNFSFAGLKGFSFVAQAPRRGGRGGGRGACSPSTFSEIVLYQECFPGNLFFFILKDIQNFFCPRHSQNLVGGPVVRTLSVSLILEFDPNYRK